MATSTNIQYLVNTAKDEFGATVSIKTASDRRQIESFIAGGAITAGDWVVFDTTATDAGRVLTVVQAPATAGQSLVVGVCIKGATAAGDVVDVVVEGYVEGANVVTGVGSGLSLTTSGVTAGRAIAYATGTHTTTAPCGVTLEASAANTCDVWVLKRF